MVKQSLFISYRLLSLVFFLVCFVFPTTKQLHNTKEFVHNSITQNDKHLQIMKNNNNKKKKIREKENHQISSVDILLCKMCARSDVARGDPSVNRSIPKHLCSHMQP